MPTRQYKIPPVADLGPALVDGQQLQQIVNALNQAVVPVVGVSEVDFGTTPRVSMTLAVTGQPTILAGSICQAWPSTTDATDDHSADEHAAENPLCWVSDVSPGVGFTLNVQARQGFLSGGWNVNWSYV